MKSRFHTRQTTFRQLEIFKEVAERLSVTEAAQALHLAQPTVSTQLGKLAETIGAPLFEQVGKRLYLTDAGREILTSARELFDVLDRLEMRLAQRAGLALGTLRLGAVTTAKYIVPAQLGAFCRQYPGIEVEFQVANRATVIQRLQENLDDLYVFSHPPYDLDITATPLIDNPLVVIAPHDHPLAGKRGIRWSALAEDRLLMREAGSGTRYAIERHFAKHKIALHSQMTIASNEAIKEAVAAGLGISILSRHTLTHMAPGNLVELDVVGFPILNTWYLVHWKSRVLSPVAEAFKQQLARA